MEPQNENLNENVPLAQQPSQQNFFEKNKPPVVIGVVALVVLIIGGLYFLNQRQSQPTDETASEPTTQTPSVQSVNFRDDELGISFQIPESWGNTIVKNDFSSTQILREILFSNQPNVKLVSFTKHRLYPAQFDQQGISSSADIKSFCENQLTYLSSGDEPKTINGQDVFRQNGVYNFGDCNTNPPLLNISKKTSTESVGWIPVDDPKTSTQKIEFSRSFFWSLQNQIYSSLTLKVDVPDTTSDGFCTIQFFYGGSGPQLRKSFGCINHKEKEFIEAAFRDFDSTQLSKEAISFVSSLQTYPADKAASIYDNYFKDKAVFRDTVLGISFIYPSAFGQPKYDASARVLEFPTDENDVLHIEINTLEDIVRAEKEAAECDGPCLGPLTSQERWEEEKDILAQSALGQIQCSFGGDYCGIADIGNIKMLVRYYKQWPRTDGIRKEYAFYVGDKRFDFLTNSYGVYTHDFAEYRKGESTDFALKLVQEILESIEIEK